MNKENNNKTLKPDKTNSNSNKKITKLNTISLKKHLIKKKVNFISLPSNLQGLDDKSFENLKLLLKRKQNSNLPLILPSLSYIPFRNKIRLVSSNNNIFRNNNNNSFNISKNNYVIKLRNININKRKEKPGLFGSFPQNKSAIDLNNENLGLKQRLDKFEIKYNYNSIKNSRVDSYRDNAKTVRKNIRKLFFHKIGNFGNEGLNRKVKYLSFRRYNKIRDNKDNSKKVTKL